ncbi:MAG TPA: tetratricopeptide repeat protein [Candidatus Binatia bacterium]
MRKLLISLLALALLFAPSPSRAQEDKPRDVFLKAYGLFAKGDSRPAEELFLRTLDKAFLLEDYSLYYLGLIAAKTGNSQVARQHFSQLQQKFPDSVWAPHAGLQLVKAAMAEKNYVQAIELCRTLRSQRAKKEISDEATYLLGQAREAAGDWKQSYDAYQELRHASPLSPFDAAARKAVAGLREKFPELFGLTTPEAMLTEADLLTREQVYADAEKFYRKALEQTPKGISRPRVLSALANVYRAQRKREDAGPILVEIVERYPDSPEAPGALNQLAMNHWNRDEDLKALEYFKRLRERYPKSSFVDFAELAAARIYEALGKPDDALAAYGSLAKRSSAESQMREDAAWRAAWIYYLRKDDKNANAAFKRIASGKDNARWRTAALYWQARTALRMEQNDEARQLFLAIMRDPEETYYKALAAPWLARLGVAVEEKKPPEPTVSTLTPAPLSAAQSFHFLRAQELADLALNPLAAAELDEVKNQGAEELSLRLMLMREYARAGAFGRSTALAHQIQFPRAAEELARYRFPLAYWETVQKLAKENSLDPYLVVALIRQESLFDPRAVSPASAFGLMQLLHSTATRTASRLKLAAPHRDGLFEPELNLTLGIHHLKELLQRHSNNLVKAIAAYNAGENAVSRWETQLSGAEDDEFVERIPYSETQLYVKLVLRNLRVYRKLYGEQK